MLRTWVVHIRPVPFTTFSHYFVTSNLTAFHPCVTLEGIQRTRGSALCFLGSLSLTLLLSNCGDGSCCFNLAISYYILIEILQCFNGTFTQLYCMKIFQIICRIFCCISHINYFRSAVKLNTAFLFPTQCFNNLDVFRTMIKEVKVFEYICIYI